MTEESMPEEVRDLIMKHIDSVAQLEALLFLHARPAEQWEMAAIAKRLYAPPGDMTAALAGLVGDGFVTRIDERYCWVRNSGHAAAVAALADAYDRHLVPITNLIHSKPRHIRAFSDAFKLRKE